MIFRARTQFLFLLALLTLACALHIDEQPNSELQALKQKQQYIKDQLQTLDSYASNINSQLRNATTDKQRVQILETALTDERQSIFELKNKIIYPLNESETACKQLTDQQKTLYLKRINQTRTQLNKLQQINLKLNQSSPQIRQVSDDIQKQFIQLQNMEDIINITCNQNLTPTIFQSNLKAKNWILGPQTMKDLKQQYAQRALIFHNITNCPLETPFFDPSSQICIKCEEPNPLFNMFDKECTRCQNEEEYDADKRICRSKPHYTNFTKVKNWNLDGGSLPQVDKNLTPCPDDKPYFNGVICVACDLPLYWSVSANLCKKCEKGYAFDLNTQQCQKIVKYELTILQNTKWVSQNLTKVIQDRTKILQKNKTTGNYHYCPQKASPYYDGTTCVPCEYFDIDQLRCVVKPNGTQYDDNMKRFLAPEPKKETNPNTMRYISANKLTDTSTENCNSSHPYFDGIACIQCLKPFDIFNIDQRKCVSCDPEQTYVESSHKCQPRQKIMISENFDRLLATPKVTVPEYKQFLIRTINDNPDAIIHPCQQKSHYSNLTNCFPCNGGEYFNVQKLRCQGCDGVYFDSNQTCKTKVYIFTNLKAPNIVDMGQTTVDQENEKIGDFLKTHEGSYICPIDKPYAIQNKTCGTCPNLFSYSELVCKECTEWNIYNPTTRKCQQAAMLVNFTDVHRILVSDEETLVSFKEEEQKVRNQNPNNWKICPGDRPYTKDRQSCFNCTGDSPYFNYTVKECQACPDHYVFDPVTVRCTQQFFITLINADTQPKLLGYDNYTLNDFKADQQANKRAHPTILCNASQSFGTVTGCKQCNQPTPYFDIREKECSEVKYLINFQKISPDYLIPSEKTLDLYNAEEERFRRQATFLTKKCSDTTPYTTDRTYCFNCSEGEYFNFGNRKCEKCPEGQAYMRDLKNCKQLFYVTKITPLTQPNMKGYSDYTIDDYRRDQANIKANNPFQQCPDNAPYGTVNGCQQCQQPTPYFDIKKRICSSAKKLINFSNIGNNYILADGRNLSSYQENEKNFKLYSQSLTVDCPASAPFTSDRETCFVCKDPENIFNFQTKRCQSCPRGADFSVDKKKCLRLFYITNFNDQSQRKMVAANDYTVSDYRTDQQKLRRQNPYKDCNATEPYGTLDGCKKCTVPEEYFDIKNRVCTAVKRLINFDAVGNNYILREGKSLDDYRKDQQAYGSSSDLPLVVCPTATPFTSNRVDCFACSSPNLYFNLESKTCQACSINQAYDVNLKRCVQKQYYTLLTSATERTLLQSDNYTVQQYKDQQAKIKTQVGSSECPSAKPYATDNGCIACDSATPYFNIRSKTCQACDTGKVYFQANHQCLLPAYLTDFTNLNIKESANFTVDDARKLQNDRASRSGYTAVKCTGSKPFATLDGCIACNDTKAPYFNIKTLTCEGCVEFYQYFKDRRCNDYVALTNTQEMIGYFEVDNYTKYNVEKMNNFTYITSPETTKFCPANSPFLSIDNVCVACNTSSAPIFNLKEKKCVNVEFLPLSNPQYMKFYIENGDATMAALKKEIDVLKSKGVNVQLCPQDKPYYSHNQCITCPTTAKYFDLAIEDCKACNAGDNCISA